MTTEERAHLVHLLKLSIKVLLQSALSLGRSLDAEHAPLQQFFVVLEHCLKHGLKGETVTPPHPCRGLPRGGMVLRSQERCSVYS